MFKKNVLTVFIVMVIASFTLSAESDKSVTSALFFQYSLDNNFRQIDSVGAYMRSSQFNDIQVGSSFGATFELPIGYNNDKMSIKYSGFGGVSIRFKVQGIDNQLTIGPSIAATLISDTYYRVMLFDLGVFVDMANSYRISEKVDATMGCSFIYDVFRYSFFETASANATIGAEQDFSQLSGKIYLGFSVSK
ncbi:MAG: hypothetical protein JEY71_11460 [Sphaerochaeta sp.]|nr:hypothetical protein [Sphaerochaeta sp.]